MKIEEIKQKKIIYKGFGINPGFLSIRILNLLKNHAFNQTEIISELELKRNDINSTLLSLRKKGKIIAFWVEGEKQMRFTLTKNAEEIGIKYD